MNNFNIQLIDKESKIPIDIINKFMHYTLDDINNHFREMGYCNLKIETMSKPDLELFGNDGKFEYYDRNGILQIVDRKYVCIYYVFVFDQQDHVTHCFRRHYPNHEQYNNIVVAYSNDTIGLAFST